MLFHPSTFKYQVGKFVFFEGGCLAAMVDFGRGINEWLRIHLNLNCVVECRRKQNDIPLVRLFISANSSFPQVLVSRGSVSLQTFEGARAQTSMQNDAF